MQTYLDQAEISYIILVIGTLAIAILLSLVLRRSLNIFIVKYAARLKTDPTNFTFLKNSVSFIVFSFAIFFIFYKIPYLKSLGAALFAGAGVLAAIIGFASQKAFSNIISGIFILIFKPFKVNDTLNLSSNYKGRVEEITLRHTIIKDYENRRIVIPNSIIGDEVIVNSNITDEFIRKHIEFGISYDSDVDKAIRIIGEEAVKHPFFLDRRTEQEIKNGDPAVPVRLIALSEFSVNLKAYVWTRGNDDAFALQCDLLKSVFDRFNAEGIEIPFPYRTIVFKKDIDENKIEQTN